MSYELPVVVITDLEDADRIESFYALVNKSGTRLNRPEVTKAEFAETPFHLLIDDLANDEHLFSLGIFTERNTVRMNNYELIGEFLATVEFGYFDKKQGVDKLYAINDANDPIWDRLRNAFSELMTILVALDQACPLKITRFRKRADFLSLSFFFWTNKTVSINDMKYAHRVFSTISPGIAPSNLKCDVLRSYAHYCVSQSHMKVSRVARHDILSNLLANEDNFPTPAQASVLTYFNLNSTGAMLIQGDSWKSLNIDMLEKSACLKETVGEFGLG